MSIYAQPSRYVDRPSSAGLAEVVEMILDKGLVIDVYVRVSLVGIELLTIDARIVIASVDTYLRFAEAVNRLDLRKDDSQNLPELVEGLTERGASSKTRGAIEGAKSSVKDTFERITGRDDDDDERQEAPRRRKAPARRPRRREDEE
jgi:hypothetical protein